MATATATATATTLPDDQLPKPGDEARPASSLTPAATSTPPAPPAGCSNRGAREPASTAAASPFFTDGRVRNPVPTKLQGITNNKNGNFAVMHIDLSGTKPSERNAAAKRTSEETEARARRANQAGWQPVRRSKSAWHGDDADYEAARSSSSANPSSRPAAALVSAAAAAAPETTAGSPSASAPQPPQPSRIPSPHDVKAEQARLLTLLRTLHPILVVDQLCRALAYFGGIPGAPPPPDGSFPQSAATNGSGLLLVGWLSEIFPPVDDPASLAPPLHLPPLSAVAAPTSLGRPEAASPGSVPNGPTRRARGRPKGSKSTKVRKDKGIKKSRLPSSTAALPGAPDEGQSSVDRHGLSSGTSANAAGDSMQSAQPAPTGAPAPAEAASASNLKLADLSTTSTPGGRKRGRPKGSKNRPKEKPDSSRGTSDCNKAGQAAPAQGFSNPLPSASNAAQIPAALPDANPNGAVPTHGSSGSTVQNDAPLSVSATDTPPIPDTGLPPALYTGHLRGQDRQTSQDSPQAKSLASKPPLRTRTAKRPAQNDNQAPADGAMNKGHTATQNVTSMNQNQDERAKRRRISKESGQHPGVGMESQSLPNDMTTSPVLNPNFSGASPQLPTPRSFDSQKSTSRPPVPATGSGQNLQQHQLHQQQQQPQRFYGQQSQQQSPIMSTADQRQHGAIPASGPPRQRSQIAGAYGSQQQANVSPQMLYTQQQPMSSQMGSSLGRHGANFSRSMTGSHSQYANMGRQNSVGSGSPALPQQRSAVAAGGQQPQDGARQAHGFSSHHHQQATPQSQAMSSFHGYGEQSYLNMDYGLTERDVQDAAAVTALGSPTQLEAALTQPKLRDHMFQGIERH